MVASHLDVVVFSRIVNNLVKFEDEVELDVDLQQYVADLEVTFHDSFFFFLYFFNFFILFFPVSPFLPLLYNLFRSRNGID